MVVSGIAKTTTDKIDMVVRNFLAAIPLVTISSFAPALVLAQSVDVTTLSADDQARHRIGYCGVFGSEALFDFEISDLLSLQVLLGEFYWENENLAKGVRSDTEAAFLLGEKSVTQEELDVCTEDLRDILRKQYVPNYSYMGANNQ